MWLRFAFGVVCFLFASPAAADSFRVGAAVELRRSDTMRALAGFIVLELPLARWGAPRVSEPPRFAEPRGFAEGPKDGSHEQSSSVKPVDAPVKSQSPPPKPEPAALPPADAGFARFLVRAALRVQGFASASERLDGISTRARVSAVLPELSLRAMRSTDQTLRLSPSGSYVTDYTQTGGAGLTLEARAVWHLDRVVFADEELRVERLRVERARQAARLVADVLELLFKVERARRRLAETELGPDERLESELDLLRATSALDVLTDGEFGREETRRKVRAGNFEEKR